MNSLPKRHFWNWFKRHQHIYLQLHRMSKKDAAFWIREMTTHLRAYCKAFSFSLAIPHEGNARLTITVDGKAKHFKKTDIFIATAPIIPGWDVQALEDPTAIDLLLDKEIEAAGIHPSEFYFSFNNNTPGNVDLVVYHPMYTTDKRRVFLELAYGALYNVLGERSFGMDLRYLEVDNLSYAGQEPINRLSALPGLISRHRSDFVVDANGMLVNEGM